MKIIPNIVLPSLPVSSAVVHVPLPSSTPIVPVISNAKTVITSGSSYESPGGKPVFSLLTDPLPLPNNYTVDACITLYGRWYHRICPS
ncbi:unnamed protein product [Didymodactylos carnosus]|uniref:Uncharacterized protein n=2 Tax=Didymodactylos carnosus TaxID=1234261 RepID=A0A814MMI1_9BILA|nr:unnamed protein product [Didymodactylos carnosus]CAF3847650.1 unnamed protein product [Didymodactylos carnosus]